MLAAVPHALVERYGRLLAGEVSDPLGGVSRKILSRFARVYEARIFSHIKEGGAVMQDRRNRHVAEVLNRDGRVADVTLTLPPEAVERAQALIAADLQGAMEQAGTDAHELLVEWVLIEAGLDRLDALVFRREDEEGIRRRLYEGFFDVFAEGTISPRSVEKFKEAIVRVYLEAFDAEDMGVSKIESLLGLRDAASLCSVRLPEAIKGYRRTGSEQAYTLFRDAMAQRKFARVERPGCGPGESRMPASSADCKEAGPA